MKITKVWFDDDNIFIQTDSGHIIGNPLSWFDRLNAATKEQLSHYRIGKSGESLHWEELDEDLTLESFFDFKRELKYAKI